ncbi:hypothetical protein NSIN_20278 [Nitrosotalea sinensis]|uniref:Uncharacterized protein n=1 Tax=Nitrosotalea sinensis TaxID=1499975 RepID=A0A2H1EFF0_9ARCH|nr:hypothetical protein NSIN_20278 [Candidatus Nitrosotalea sinensis]
MDSDLMVQVKLVHFFTQKYVVNSDISFGVLYYNALQNYSNIKRKLE